MNRHRQNFAWQYHNGGIWPFAGALWITALAEAGRKDAAHIRLAALAGANSLNDWGFNEWLHGKTFRPGGMRGQSWNAATYLIAHHAVHQAVPLFRQDS
jgi:glycogen debranching enzyme